LLHQQRWGIDDALQIVRVDADAEEPERCRKPAVALVGDAAPTLRKLIDALARRNRARPSRRDEMLERQGKLRARLAKLAPQIGYPEAIRAELPEDGVFVEEGTQMGLAAPLLYPAYPPRTLISPRLQDSLGWGYAAGLGVKDARRALPVVAIAGDGGFMFTATEMATAVHHRIPLTVVVFNDGAFGNVRRNQEERFGNRIIASDLSNPDFVRFAESFGAAA